MANEETTSERIVRILDRALFGRWAWTAAGAVAIVAVVVYLVG